MIANNESIKLNDVPTNLITYEMCLEAIKSNGIALKYDKTYGQIACCKNE